MPSDQPISDNAFINDKLRQQFEELAKDVMARKFGPDGPPKDLTFREIEEIGYEIAQTAARTFEAETVKEHQKHFEGDQPCPGCGQMCGPSEPSERTLLTRLGPVELSEIKYRCDACRRSFFPSASGAAS